MPLPIHTQRLVLRNLAYEDVSALLEIVSHPSVARITTNIEASEGSVRKYIDLQNSYQPFEKDRYYDLGVERTKDGRLVGLIGLMCQDHRQGLIGWALGIDERGNGYATEAASALIAFGFSELGLHRIYAVTSSVNRASWRVMERAGMRKEAQLREAEFREGEWIDTLIYAILQPVAMEENIVTSD